VVVYKASERPIPAALIGSLEFQDLNDVQQQNFSARLNYIEEICHNSQQWLHSREGFESTSDFIDVIELDLFINLSCGEVDRSVSPWLIHSSRVFDTSPQAMLSSLPKCITDDSADVQIGFSCDESEFLDWLDKRVDCMSLLLDKFYESDTIDNAIGRLIGIDICLSTLLLGVSKQRFNSKLMD
jgi:hypothetical protein